MPVRPCLLAATAGTAALVASAPAAAAPVLQQPLDGCYVSADARNRELVAVEATGFTASAIVDPYVDGLLQVTGGVPADVDGHIGGTVSAPYQPAGERTFELRLVERGNPVNTVVAHARVSALTVALFPRRARPSQKVRYRGRGFIGDGAVYAHYLYGGEVRTTVRLARPAGPCGRFSVRARQIPVAHPETGRWTVQVDQQRAYDPAPVPVHVRLTIDVRRTVRTP